jgi:hypothetical protein
LLGGILLVLPRVSEISINGNVIKLLQANKEAKSTINKLFKIQLVMLRQTPGGLRSIADKVDPRVEPFFDLCEEITRLGLDKDLKADVVQTANVLLHSHQNNFMGMLYMHKPPKDEFYSDDELIEHAVMQDYKNIYIKLRDIISS